jgi:hypothetical protein
MEMKNYGLVDEEKNDKVMQEMGLKSHACVLV